MQKNSMLLEIIVCLLLLFCIAHATSWYVHPDSALNSIQAALDSCADNDMILVAAGIYYENLIWPNTQNINLTSESGQDSTIIDGDSSGSVIRIDTEVNLTTVINGFTIQNGTSLYGGGIYCENSSPQITANIIIENIANWNGGGIYCDHSSPNITNNSITKNTVLDGGGSGIGCYYSSPTVVNNTVTKNTILSFEGGGIGCNHSSPIINNCTISCNNGDGVFCQYNSQPAINYNNITDNAGYGVQNSYLYVWVNAQYNWWGDPSGPGGAGHGTGDEVSEKVDYYHWLNNPVGVEECESFPSIFTTLKISPNPFRNKTEITYCVGRSAKGISATQYGGLKIYDITGRIVKKFSVPTAYSLVPTVVSWDGRDNSGRKVSNGVYFLRLNTVNHTETKKLLLIR